MCAGIDGIELANDKSIINKKKKVSTSLSCIFVFRILKEKSPSSIFAFAIFLLFCIFLKINRVLYTLSFTNFYCIMITDYITLHYLTWCFEHSGDISCYLLVKPIYTEGKDENTCLWIYYIYIYIYIYIYLSLTRKNICNMIG